MEELFNQTSWRVIWLSRTTSKDNSPAERLFASFYGNQYNKLNLLQIIHYYVFDVNCVNPLMKGLEQDRDADTWKKHRK